MDLNLTGRSVLVTGGSKGIGLAIAQSFAAEGCNLHLAARTASELSKVADDDPRTAQREGQDSSRRSQRKRCR